MRTLLFVLLMLSANGGFAANCRTVESDVTALACNIYFESRGESLAGQMLVGFVTINRSHSEEFPETIKDVVKQRTQFSWRSRRSVKIDEPDAWERSKKLSRFMLALADHKEIYDKMDFTKGSLYFHKVGTPRPKLNVPTKRTITLGQHVALRPVKSNVYKP